MSIPDDSFALNPQWAELLRAVSGWSRDIDPDDGPPWVHMLVPDPEKDIEPTPESAEEAFMCLTAMHNEDDVTVAGYWTELTPRGQTRAWLTMGSILLSVLEAVAVDCETTTEDVLQTWAQVYAAHRNGLHRGNGELTSGG